MDKQIEANYNLPITRLEMIYLQSILKFHQAADMARTLNYKIFCLQRLNDILTPKDVVIRACMLNGITVADVTSEKRQRPIVDTRACISNLIKFNFPEMKPQEIGRVINKDRCTVLHHFEVVASVKELRGMYEDLRRRMAI